MLTFSEAKRAANLKEHGLDLADADKIFDAPVLAEEDAREDYGEMRINVIGWLNGQIVHLSYTDDGVTLRAISLRLAEKHEIRRYARSLQP